MITVLVIEPAQNPPQKWMAWDFCFFLCNICLVIHFAKFGNSSDRTLNITSHPYTTDINFYVVYNNTYMYWHLHLSS